MSVVQLFNRERRAFNDFSAVNAENKQAWTDAIFAYALYYPIVEFLSSTAIALVIWRGGCAVLHNAAFLAALPPGLHPDRAPGFFGTVTLGVLIAFIQYAQRFFRPIQDLSDKYNILQAAMAASERVFKLLDTEPDHRLARASPSPATAQAASSSATSGSPIKNSTRHNRRASPPPPTKTSAPTPTSSGSCAASTSSSNPTRPRPSSATPAPARPPSPA